MRIILLTFLSLFIFSCQTESQPGPLTFIPTLKLMQGQSLVADLSVYKTAGNIKLEILPYPELNLEFDASTDKLVLTAGDIKERLHFIPAKADGHPLTLAVQVIPLAGHTFTFSPDSGVKKVVVMGGFNDWSRTALPMVDNNNDGILENHVFLAPQRHEYKFVVDGEELIDPENPVFISNNIGGWNSILDLSSLKESLPGNIIKSKKNKNDLLFDYLPPEPFSALGKVKILLDNSILPDDRFSLKSDKVQVKILKSDNGLLRIIASDLQGRILPENHTIIVNGKPITPKNDPDNWHFSVIYNMLVDRFLDGDPANNDSIIHPDLHHLANFKGGDILGITARINDKYLSDLGISAIWISPLQKQPDLAYREWIPPNRVFTGYHGYWPVKARQIEPRFGTSAELQTMVESAHKNNIKVLLDFVSNHVHEEHDYYKDHPGWFGAVTMDDGTMNIRNWSEETRLTTWFDDFIPSFNYPAAPEAIDSVVADAMWWLNTYKFDGFRQDAVKHVPHTFWKSLGSALRREHPGKYFYQIGETFGSDNLIGSYVNPLELSAQFNFSIYFNARGPLSENRADFSHLSESIVNNISSFGPIHLMGNLTSSHDQLRFMSYADEQLTFSDNGTERSFNNPPGVVKNPTSYLKLKNFHALNFALPGVPVIYYGDEIGLMGAGDPDNRRMMKFGNQLNKKEQKLKEDVSEIIKLRRQNAALSIGDWVPLVSQGETFIFMKVYFDEKIVVVLHQSPENRDISFMVPVEGNRLINMIDGDKIMLEDGQASFTVMPYSFSYFRLK